MDKTIREKLEGVRPERVTLDLEPILCFMENSGIDILDRNLKGPMGIGSIYCIYLDFDNLIRVFDTRMIGYVILHEIAHYKRIVKMGKYKVFEMLSSHDFDIFSNHIIEEEIIADRYARYSFLKLTKEVLPKEMTQQLDLEYNSRRYREKNKAIFGVIENNEKSYVKLVESFVIN